MPVSRPSNCITTGKKNGVSDNRMPASTVPLMMLPYSLTASATVREISPIRLNGSISGVGLM